MITTGIESRVKVQDIVSNQVPSFILDENPKFIEFLKTYYTSQEYQGGPTDLSENLDQYLKLDNLVPEVIVDSSTTVGITTVSDKTINVTSTKGFPQEYGLIKIDDEIISYTGITTNSFTGCIRGFSGITNYHDVLDKEELVFEESSASAHNIGASVQNLSSLFLKEFFEKTKFTFANDFQGRKLTDNLNVGNFIKEIKSFYTSKGTDDSIETLLRILFGKSGKTINLEQYLIKPSDADFTRREVLIVEAVSGDLSKLKGQTVVKNTDSDTRAVVSEVEPFTRRGTVYYKINLYVGYDDKSSIEGTFEITPATKSQDTVLPGSSVITVDSTNGFDPSGTIYSGDNIITYTEKNYNQFLGCSGIENKIYETSNIRSDKIYYGYENGDTSKKCEFRITGVISDIDDYEDDGSIPISKNQILTVKNIGDYITNPIKKSKKQIFANSWIYNTAPTVDIEEFGADIRLKTSIDKSQFKVGDRIEIIDRGLSTVGVATTSQVVYPLQDTDIPFISNIQPDDDGLNRTLTLGNFIFNPEDPDKLYSIRRRVNKAYSKYVPIEYGNYNIISDIQNIYTNESSYAYVAFNSLPSSSFEEFETYTMPENDQEIIPPVPFVSDIEQQIFRYQLDPTVINPLQDVDEDTENSTGVQEFTTIKLKDKVKFLSGDRIFYEPETDPIVGLTTGSYYVEVISNPGQEDDRKKLKLYTSRSHIASDTTSLKMRMPSSGIGTHTFTLFEHKTNLIKPKKAFKKFSLNPNLKSGTKEETTPGETGVLINGVEISNYKTNEKIYYGPLTNVSVLIGGSNYDVLNVPKITTSSPTNGSDAKVQPVVSGELKEIIVDSSTSNFNIKSISGINVTGGNVSGGSYEPILVKKRTEHLFDARPTTDGGGIDISTDQLSFIDDHNFINGQEITYRNETSSGNVGIDTDGNNINDATLINNATYYVRVDNNITIKLFDNFDDYINNTNSIKFGQESTGYGYGGIQKFVSGEVINTLSEIKILDPAKFTNRKLIVKPVGISISNNTINFKNHNFETGDLVNYNFDTSAIGISDNVGLSTEKSYFILKEDSDSFRICDAGIGGTITSNFEAKKYIKFTSNGSGYQYFKYPDIVATIDFVSAGIGTTSQTQSLELTPVVKGSIVDAYLYENGAGYGSDVINFEKTPNIKVIEGQKAQIDPIISAGLLIDTNIQFQGYDYFSPPDLTLFDPTNSGTGAKLRAVSTDGKITKVIIENSGRGYSNNSRIEITNSGSGVLFDSNVRSLDINNVNKIEEKQYEIFSENKFRNGLDYSVSGYYDNLRAIFGDNESKNSGIIGWAYDGNPIYGPFGSSDPKVLSSTTKRLISGYNLDISNISDRPSETKFPLGFFTQDYVFNGNGDLDENNGRFAKTAEFPNGIYAYHATLDVFLKPYFPYFIGNSYRTNLLEDNKTLDQDFDLNNSGLLRNTFPHKVSELNANNDYIIETSEIADQRIKVESVTSGSISSIEIIDGGQKYQVKDALVFDEKNTNGGGAKAEVSLIEGKEIQSIQQSITSFPQAKLIWEDSNNIRVFTDTPHGLSSGDYVSISGISSVIPSPSTLKLDGSYERITVDSPVILRLEDTIQSQGTGAATTEIYVSNISDSIRIGNELLVNDETLTVLNIFPNKDVLRVERGDSSLQHSTGTAVTAKSYSFTIQERFDYFDSELDEKIYFNPNNSVGIGTTFGDTHDVTFDFGFGSVSRSIPMGRIYLEGHKFSTNDKVTLTLDSSGITLENSYGETHAFDQNGEYYIINESPNTVGIKTHLFTDVTQTRTAQFTDSSNLDIVQFSPAHSIGVRVGDKITIADGIPETFADTTKTAFIAESISDTQFRLDKYLNGNSTASANAVLSRQSGPVYFISNGDNSDKYLITHANEKETADIDKITATVSVSTSHGLTNGDIVKLQVEPNLNVGIGTSTIVNVIRNQNLTIGINTVIAGQLSRPNPNSTLPWTFTTSPQKHNFKNGDKIIYSRTDGATLRYGSGVYDNSNNIDPQMQNVAFYVRVLNETDFTVSETYNDVFKQSILGDTTLSITNSSISLSSLEDYAHTWALVNPQIEVIKGNSVVFDLSDTSLSGNNFKIYYDKEFNNEFISIGNTSVFNVVGTGTVGVTSSASVTINYSENFPEKLYYNLESSSGVGVNTADKDIINYNEILYVDSNYTGSYAVSGIGSTTDIAFTISLEKESEKDGYLKADCTHLKYDTTSSTAFGKIKNIDIISAGENYKKLPLILDISSKNGQGFEVIPTSSNIGKINDVDILNVGFEYSSDKTLTPNAFIAPKVTLRNSNVVRSIEVVDGGKNYIKTPSPVLVDFNTREKITGGNIELNITAESITSVDILDTPHGVSSDAELFVENNSNGISIIKVESSNTGIFTCVLSTPLIGFSPDSRLNVGDEVFIEGIQKFSESGDGFNSADLGYRFFKVTGYDTSQSDDRIEINVSEYTTNTGIAKTIQDSSGTIVSKNNYPEFKVNTSPSLFFIGEELLVDNNEVDLKVESHSNTTDLNISGSFDLVIDQKITGKTSGNIAFVSKIEKIDARYKVDYSNKRSFGWKSNTGRLSEDYQVLPDNDYYQTLSYSVRSPMTWEEIKSPINRLVHVSGMKNFADSEIMTDGEIVGGISTANTDLDVFLDLIGEQRVDTVNNFDFTKDIDVVDNTSKFLEFENSTFIPYTKAKTNVVLSVDDISSQFSQFESNPLTYKNVFEINPNRDYRNYTFKVRDLDNTEVQLTRLSILSHPDGSSYINEQETLVNVGTGFTHIEGESYGDFELIRTEFEETYLRFTPKDPFDKDYDIKYLEKRFGDSTLGTATTSIGFVDLMSSVTGVTTGAGIGTVINVAKTDYNSIVADVFLNTLITDKINFVRLYVTHDGTNTNIAEYYYDSTGFNRSAEPIGILTSLIDDSGNLKIEYENTEEIETVVLRARSIAFGSDASTLNGDTYRFSLPNQPATFERSSTYQSKYVTVTDATGPIEVFSLDKNLFDATSGIFEVKADAAGLTPFAGSVLYDVSFIHDNTNTYTQEGPALYATGESASGIGTFGSELNGSDFKILFYPNRLGTGTGDVEISALAECYYTELDTINTAPDLQYGSVIESLKTSQYLALQGERINKKNFILRNEQTPIFAKTFDPGNITNFNPVTGVFTVPNHFFSDGEELIYTPQSTFTGVPAEAIEHGGSDLPTTIYAVVGEFEFDTFKIALTKHGTALTGYDNTGSGNAHQFAMKETLSKAIITLDGMVQSPVAYTNISHTLTGNSGSGISSITPTFALSGIGTVNVSDVLKVDDEFMLVRSVGLGEQSTGPITGSGTSKLVTVERGVLGTAKTDHSDTTSANVFKGSYNIIGDEIHFIDAPKGNSSVTRTENNLRFQTSEFAGRVFLRQDYSTNRVYDNVSNKFTGIGRTFSLTVDGNDQVGIGTSGGNGIVLINGIYQTPEADNNPNNNFEIIEDAGISSVRFTGYIGEGGIVGSSTTDVNSNQLPRGGIIVSLGSSGGQGYAPLQGAEIDLITDYHHDSPTGILNGKIQEVAGKFVTKTSFDVILNQAVNTINGISTSNIVGITTGMELLNSDQINYLTQIDDYYEDLNDASKWTIQLNKNPVGVQPSDGLFNVSFGYRKPLGGSGYFNNPTVTIVEDCLALPGVGVTAVITATVGAGGTAIFNIDTPGSGHADYPQAFVSEPSYQNLEVIGTSRVGLGPTTDTGIGLLMDIEVGAASTTVGVGSTAFNVTGFNIKRPGYSFRKGDKFTPVGLVTAMGLSSPIEPIEFEVVDVYNDTFASWQFGELDFIDSIKPYQDGFRTRFPLFYLGELFSVQVAEESRMNIENALIVFVNGVLQNPGENYFFSGGASFTFSVPPRTGDQVSVFFYRGTRNVDDEQVGSVVPTVERGDIVQVKQFNNIDEQNSRRIFDYTQSDVLETSPYTGKGLYNSDHEFGNVNRPVSWSKQKKDLILGGDYVFKTRRSLLSQIYPTTNIISNIQASTGSVTFYVENVDIFRYENPTTYDWSILAADDASEFDPATFNVTLTGDTLSGISVNSPGAGYTNTSGTIDLLVTVPPSTIRSGWPDTVDGPGGALVPDNGLNEKYFALPPQKSTAGIATATLGADGTIVSISGFTQGTGYPENSTPIVTAPLPESKFNLSGEVTGVQGFSGIVTHINRVSEGGIADFQCSEVGPAGNSAVAGTHTYTQSSGISGGSGTGAEIQVTIEGTSPNCYFKEIKVTKRGSGFQENEVLTLSTDSLPQSTDNPLALLITHLTDKFEFKLREDYLNNQKTAVNSLIFNASNDGTLSQGDYLSISNTNVEPGTYFYTYGFFGDEGPVLDAAGISTNTTEEDVESNNRVSVAGTFIDAIYRVAEGVTVNNKVGLITCCGYAQDTSNFNSPITNANTDNVGSASSERSIGTFSWGKITINGMNESYTVNGNTTDADLSEYPQIQRKSKGLRDTGSLIERLTITP